MIRFPATSSKSSDEGGTSPCRPLLFASAELDTPSGSSIVVVALTPFVVTRIRRPRPAGSVG